MLKMNEKLDINTLLTNKERLLAADWEPLVSLQKKYPFSPVIAQLLAKKHFLETGFVESSYFQKSLQLQDNPGQSVAFLNIWEEKTKTKKSKKKLTRKKEPQKTSETRKEKSDEHYSEFTQWLLDKNLMVIGDQKEKSEQEPGAADYNLRDEIVSESLARIYEKQGLIKEAIEMYRKLSLINPEKSAYFAEIIENLKKR